MLHVHIGPEPASLDILAQLHEIAEPAHDEGVSVRLRVVRGQVVDQICTWSRRSGVGLVVTGTRGLKPSSTPVHDRTVRALINCSPVPVVAIRPGEDGMGTADGPILLVSGGNSLPLTIAQQLSRVWRREIVNASLVAGPKLIDTVFIRRSDILTVVPFDPDCACADGCVELMTRATGGLALVGRGGCGCAEAGGPRKALSPFAR